MSIDALLMPFRQPSSTIRVLHVDDDESQREMMRQFIGIFDSEIEIESLSSPLQVIDKISNNYYDCIIVDFKMPEINGIELSRNIREKYSTPIILYTGQGSEEVASEAFSVGINDYIKKEIEPQHYQIVAKRIRDIVEKQRIEQLYTSIVKDAKDAIAIVSNEKIVFINEAFVNLFSASSEKDIYKMNFSKLLVNNEINIIRNGINKLLEGEDNYFTTEIEIKKKNRNKIPVEIKISIIEYMGAKALLFFLRDITERRELEDTIKKSEIKYRSLVELAPDGIITLDLWGNVTWINEAFTSITGYGADEIVGKKAWSLKTLRTADVGMFFRLFIDLMRGKTIAPVEFQWVSKNGDLGWGEGRASLIKIDGKKTEILLSIRDMTERKQMEYDLRKYSKEMEEIAEERAQKLLESEKLVVAGTIASTVAHDLKGPLNTILNAVYLMDAKPEKSAEMKEMIVNAVDSASRMLNEVRNKTVSEILNYEEIDVAPFIENIVNETPITRNIEIKTELKHVTVYFDKLRMRRVIDNLIRNSIDAMPDGGLLQVSDRVEDGMVIIEVKDTGTGMPKEMIDKLFTPFHTTKASGTGLGLHYCKTTVNEHGGYIEVKSKVGVGTTFILKIPLRKRIPSKIIAPLSRL